MRALSFCVATVLLAMTSTGQAAPVRLAETPMSAVALMKLSLLQTPPTTTGSIAPAQPTGAEVPKPKRRGFYLDAPGAIALGTGVTAAVLLGTGVISF